MLRTEKIEKVREFVRNTRPTDWDVQLVEETTIPFLSYPAWIATSAYQGNSPHITNRVVSDLVIERDWQFHIFDVTDLINLKRR